MDLPFLAMPCGCPSSPCPVAALPRPVLWLPLLALSCSFRQGQDSPTTRQIKRAYDTPFYDVEAAFRFSEHGCRAAPFFPCAASSACIRKRSTGFTELGGGSMGHEVNVSRCDGRSCKRQQLNRYLSATHPQAETLAIQHGIAIHVHAAKHEVAVRTGKHATVPLQYFANQFLHPL